MTKAHIYIKGYDQFTRDWNWDNCTEIPFENYSIDETDFRNKTATIKTETNIKYFEQYGYVVKITNPTHETFSGVMLKKHRTPQNSLEYSCQDWNRRYMGKPYLYGTWSIRQIILDCLRFAHNGNKWTSGLLATKRYADNLLGGVTNINPMKTKRTIDINNKTCKEIIEDCVHGERMRVDLHYNNVGIMKFTPQHKDDFMKSVVDFDKKELTGWDYSFNTTDIITSVSADYGKKYYFDDLFNSARNMLENFVGVRVNITEPMQENINNNTTTSNTSNKTSNRNDKQTNPYKTKNKEVWITMDNCWGGSTDANYLNKLKSKLKQLGWKAHKANLGPGGIIPSHLPDDARKGVWFVVVNGADCEVFRHLGHDEFFKGMLLKRKLRPVIALINDSGDIRKGGKYYKYLAMAHDGTGKGNPGMKYPAGFLAKCGVPFFYSKGNHPKKCATMFDKGGESQKALNADYKKYVKGFYVNWNWGSDY